MNLLDDDDDDFGDAVDVENDASEVNSFLSLSISLIFRLVRSSDKRPAPFLSETDAVDDLG